MITNSGKIIDEKTDAGLTEAQLAELLELAEFRERAYEKHPSAAIARGLVADYRKLGMHHYEKKNLGGANFDAAIPLLLKALEYALRVLEYSQLVNDRWAAADIYSNLGFSYLLKTKQDTKTAAEMFNKGSGIVDELYPGEGAFGLRRHAAERYNLAMVFLMEQNYKKMMDELEAYAELAALAHREYPNNEKNRAFYLKALDLCIHYCGKYGGFGKGKKLEQFKKSREKLLNETGSER